MTERSITVLMPTDTPAYMRDAWLSCLDWALGHPEAIAAFRQDTGILWSPGTTPLDRLIDEATGADWGFVEAFVRWANVNIWGPIDEVPHG